MSTAGDYAKTEQSDGRKHRRYVTIIDLSLYGNLKRDVSVGAISINRRIVTANTQNTFSPNCIVPREVLKREYRYIWKFCFVLLRYKYTLTVSSTYKDKFSFIFINFFYFINWNPLRYKKRISYSAGCSKRKEVKIVKMIRKLSGS